MSKSDEIEDSAAPLIEHLTELRDRLIKSVLAFVIGIMIAFTVSQPILQFLLDPIKETLTSLGDPSPTLQYTSPQEYLFTLFRISMVFGFALAFPVISYQLWRFVAPGLYRSEKNAFLPFLIASPFMFILGACFAQFIVTPLAMQFFLGFADVTSIFSNVLGSSSDHLPNGAAIKDAVDHGTNGGLKITFFGKVNESLDITLKFIMAFGLCFQLPVLLTLLGKAGLVGAQGLKSMRKYAIVGILTLAAVLTPPDVTSQVILFSVVYGLYEISIWLVWYVEKKRNEELAAEGLLDDEEEEEPAEEEDPDRYG